MECLSVYEADIAKELFNISLSNAADAFSKLANEKVLVRDFDISFPESNINVEEMLVAGQEQFYVLSTEIRGKVEGCSYLILSDQEVRKLLKVFSPAHEEVKESLSEFQCAILLELDNIVTAAMVTQIANILGLFTYGDVPRLDLVSRKDLLSKFSNEIRKYEMLLNLQARFDTYSSNISPSFIWFFNKEFLSAVKTLIAEKKHLSLLKNNI